ncbi:MAG: hypothetical protein CL674_10935 [Bdellovibrionaceae bacterium]|nr:hypothetical protein [Pseudobdellovibrionaceae bacterium]|tara:strand:+ start:26702 stop:27610 length:909 start_codon:yes stop_codon:yes gene_type:complete
MLCFASICLSAGETKNLHLRNHCRTSLREILSANPHFSSQLRKHVFEKFGVGNLVYKKYSKKMSLEEVFVQSTRQRADLIRSLEALVEQAGKESIAGEIISVAIEKLETDLEINLENIRYKLEAVGGSMNLGEAQKLRGREAEVEKLLSNINSFELSARAVLAESLVALESHKVNALEAIVDNIVENKFDSVFQKIKDSPEYLDAKELEIDIVTSSYKDWMEVKTLNTNHPKRVERFAKNLIQKSQRLKRLTDKTLEVGGEKINFHVVIFTKTKLPEYFFEEMRKLGVQLHFNEVKPEKLLE